MSNQVQDFLKVWAFLFGVCVILFIMFLVGGWLMINHPMVALWIGGFIFTGIVAAASGKW